MSTKVIGLIPARYASTRFPAKALANIDGKPMIQRVYEQSTKSKKLDEVWIATDHALIYDHAKSIGANVVMTSEAHRSGTDRCFEALQKIGNNFDYVVNIQGDEPFIKPEQIDELITLLDRNVELATMVSPIEDVETLFSPNEMKVVFDHSNYALYFSRECIPHVRGFEKTDWLRYTTFYKHVAIYAYRSDVLEAITALEPSTLEIAESLEQLRWMQNGYKIKIGITHHKNISIDTPEDLQRALKTML